MNWAQRRRRRELRRLLRASDKRFDALAATRDQLNALVELLGNNIAVKEIAARYTELDLLDDLDEAEQAPLEDELRELQALDPHHIYYVTMAIAIVIIVPIRRLTRPMRRAISRWRQGRAKKPAPPGYDELLKTLLSGGAGSAILRYYFFLVPPPIAIFFGSGSGVNGTVTLRMPLSKCALTASPSARSGSWIRR
jgi:hypothetical protein